LAYRVNFPPILEKIDCFQKKLIDEFPESKLGMIKPDKLHVSLLTLSIPTDIELGRVITTLSDSLGLFSSQPILKLPFQGLSHFRDGNVLWCSLKEGEEKQQTKQLTGKLHQFLKENLSDIVETPSQDWIPHMTLYKTTFLKKRKQDSFDNNIPMKILAGSSYHQYKEEDFGIQLVDSIDLLEMKGSRDGYYKCYGTIKFGQLIPSFIQPNKIF